MELRLSDHAESEEFGNEDLRIAPRESTVFKEQNMADMQRMMATRRKPDVSKLQSTL